MLVHESALKHGIDPEEIDLGSQELRLLCTRVRRSPMPEFRLGFDRHGRLLELTVLIFDSGNELIIHSMKARPQYYLLLPDT